ncbi:hypothetical protein GCM10008995_03400 [Halobellus salinus]|uniref:Uncharacterized protein n=1 Tax=Halobellus salinus TaxID=931585 RepID=A0A830E7F3_9EURY|nr:hypothetical protein [Halobellus salinus]GGI96710.1 hypothetical protein GCM10008995_03400 [Halobellus salinus]
MGQDTPGRGTATIAVLACLVVVVSGLAVAPGAVGAQQQQPDGDVAFDGDNGELTVAVDRRNAANGSFTGSPEDVTIDIGGATVQKRTDPGNASTYNYMVGPDELAGLDSLDGQDGAGTTVTVTHSEAGSFNETVDIQHVVLGGDGTFTGDGAFRFGIVQSFGIATDGSVAVRVEVGSEEQDVSAAYRQDGATNESYLVVDRATLSDLGVLERPQEVTIFGQEQFVGGSVSVDVASKGAALTTGERLSDDTVRFESPLFEAGGTYEIDVATGGAQYLQTIEAGDRAVEVDSAAVAAESSVSLTVERNENTILNGQTVEFETRTVNGTVDGATITFDSLPGGISGADGSGANVSAVWVETQGGVERYEAGLNATTGTLTLSNAESLPRADTNEADILVQFEGATPLHATVSLQSDSDGAAAEQPSNGDETGLAIDFTTILFAVAVVLLFVVGVVVVFLLLDRFGSGTTNLSIPFGSSKSTPVGESPGSETAEVSVEVVDETIGTTYPHANEVVVRPENRSGSAQAAGAVGSSGRSGPTGHPGSAGRTAAAGLDGVNTTRADSIDLTAGEGEIELEYGTWIFEIKRRGETIGQRKHEVGYGFESDHIGLSVDPHAVEAVVTGGPDREPLSGTVVEATADAGRWTQQKPTDPEGRVRFEVPRSASTVSFTATHEPLPPAESERRVEKAAEQGVSLRIADGSGSMRVETTVGDRAWPNVEVGITPISADAKAYTEEGTVTTTSNGHQTIEGLPTGEYEVTAHPQVESVETTAAVERVTVEDGGTVGVELPVGISYTMSTAQRDRVGELEDRIEGLAAASNRDVAIPRYYGTVLTSVLELAAGVESAPERAVETGISPDATVDALLDATEAGIRAVDGAMSERRNVKLFDACEALPAATVEWTGTATLEEFLGGVADGGDHERRALRDRLRAVDETLDGKWGEVNEIAPARKLHDRVGDLARETRDIDDELTLVARTYVGVCLLDAVEGVFDHDSLVDRLNSGSY